MTGLNLPYQPLRQKLYTRTELFQGFEAQYTSFLGTDGGLCYLSTFCHGGT